MPLNAHYHKNIISLEQLDQNLPLNPSYWIPCVQNCYFGFKKIYRIVRCFWSNPLFVFHRIYYYSLMWNNFRWRRLIYILLLYADDLMNTFFTLICRSLTHYVRFLPFDCWVLRSLEDSTSYNCCWPHSLRYLNRPEINETVALLSIYM